MQSFALEHPLVLIPFSPEQFQRFDALAALFGIEPAFRQ
jgi:hypothetical protein